MRTRKKLLLVVPLILEASQEGLALIGYTDVQIQTVHEMIERYHIANIAGNSIVPTAAPIHDAGKVESVNEIDQLLQQNLEYDLDLLVRKAFRKR